jgi:hypothetical protein
MQTEQALSRAQPVGAIVIILIIIVMVLVAKQDNKDQAAVQDHYCEMRQIHTDSGGSYGWPTLDGYGECK